jgi:hypothetical protein
MIRKLKSYYHLKKVLKDIEQTRAEKKTPIFQRQKWDEEKLLGFWDKRKLKKLPEKSYFVTMFFPNGTYKEFVIIADKPTFDYQKKTFVIDTQKAYWDLMQNQYRLLYNFEYCVPISRQIHHIADKGKEIFLSVNPSNVKELIKQEYVKILASSQNIDMYLKLGMVVGFINLFLLIVMNILIFMMQKSLTKIASGGV